MEDINTEQIKLCEDYIDNNYKAIAEVVNKKFELDQDKIREEILAEIKKYVTNPRLIHYEWYYDDCPYDYSGQLEKKGAVDFNQTIGDFLENEYTGDTEATYMSRCGLRYITYGDELSYKTLNIAYEILYKVITDELKKHVDNSVDEDLIRGLDPFIDQVYSSSYAFDFFCYEFAIEFVGISDIKLCDLMSSSNETEKI